MKMNLFFVFLVFSYLFISGAYADDSKLLFSMEKGLEWLFDDGSSDRITGFENLGIINSSGNTSSIEKLNVFIFNPYFHQKIAFFRDGSSIYEIVAGKKRLWYNFDAQPGDRWTMIWETYDSLLSSSDNKSYRNQDPVSSDRLKNRFGNGSDGDINDGAVMTLMEKNIDVSTASGNYSGCFHFRLERPGVMDAGYIEEWFAPGIGCVKREWDTIAGPKTHTLQYFNTNSRVDFSSRMDIVLDKDIYAEGDSISIDVSLMNWSDTDVTIDFPSGLQVDYRIDGYLYSSNHSFVTSLTSITIPARDVYKWHFTHTPEDYTIPPGIHIVTASLEGTEISSEQKFIVSAERPSLPDGISLYGYSYKEPYNLGEPVTIILGAVNNTTEDITLDICENDPIRFSIDGTTGKFDPFVIYDDLTANIVSAGDTLFRKVVIDSDYSLLRPGDHNVQAGFTNYKGDVTVSFSVTSEPSLGIVSGTVFSIDENGIINTPAAGARVMLRPELPRNYYGEFSGLPVTTPPILEVITGDDGTFSFENVPLGAFFCLEIEKDGMFPYTETFRMLEPSIEINVVLKPMIRDDKPPLNYVSSDIDGIMVILGTDKTAYSYDSNIYSVFRIINETPEDITFTLDQTPVTWSITDSAGDTLWISDFNNTGSGGNEIIKTIGPGGEIGYEFNDTLLNKVPEDGGKHILSATLNVMESSSDKIVPGDITASIKIIIVPQRSVNEKSYEVSSNRREMIIALRDSIKADIELAMNCENIAGTLNVAELVRNYHSEIPNHRFIKMLEIDADSLIRVSLDSALVRIYYKPSDFSGVFNPKNLYMAHWSENAGDGQEPYWEMLDSRVDTVNNFIEAYTPGFSSFGLFLSDATGVDSGDGIPGEFSLYQNYPNPFNPKTTISFMLPRTGPVKLYIYNLAGQKVATLIDRNMSQGFHCVSFDGRQFSSGIYLYHIESENFKETRKMLLVK